MTAPEEPTVTAPEPWPLPNIWRLLPADVSDQAYMDTCEEMAAEVRALGAPADMVRNGVTPLADGRWLAQAWQAKSRYSWEYPPVDPAEYA